MKTFEGYDVFIQAGQSNAEGFGVGDSLYEYVEDKDILYISYDKNFSIANRGIMNNFSLSFSAKYKKEGFLKEGRKLLIVRAAVGSSGFLDGRWSMDGDLYNKMKDVLRYVFKQDGKHVLKGVLWHQGEHDVHYKATCEQHKNNLLTMIQDIRSQYGKDVLFIGGDFVHERRMATPACENVRKAMQEVFTMENNAFVNTDYLNSNNEEGVNDETIHFSAKALDILGEKYFNAYVKLIEKR